MQVVAGGGAVEAALSVYLEYLATTLGSREQLAIAEFAEALLIIPKVLITFIHIFIWLTLLGFGTSEQQVSIN
jgi:chaperonin GroEL (HSP60 family)